MPRSEISPVFWWRWLLVVVVGVIAFGLVLVLAPALTRQGFSMLVYADARHISTFGADALAYITLVHAVLGAVMFGWGVALLLVVRGPFARGDKDAWKIVALSIITWFLPDTAFSLWSGFWPNAVLNLTFAILFAVPLAATYRNFHQRR